MLNVKQVGKRYNLCRSSIHKFVNEGRFPPPIRIGSLKRWAIPTLDAWYKDGCPTMEKWNEGKMGEIPDSAEKNHRAGCG
jgi:predicted DNA-binding transcriptional regulator AlpA